MQKSYAFELGQRVTVPGLPGLQGVVSLPTTSSDGLPLLPSPGGGDTEHVYLVCWIGENGERERGNFRSSELSAAKISDFIASFELQVAAAGGGTSEYKPDVIHTRKRAKRSKRKSKTKSRPRKTSRK
jgi:hypothetical protein